MRRFSRWPVVVLALAAIGLLGFGFPRTVSGGPEADPGGRILHELRTTANALPGDAQVLYRNDLEPKWDSCDGRAGTFGWDNVIVQIHFASKVPSQTLLERADRVLEGLGWSRDYLNEQSTFLQQGWTKRLDDGSVAKVQLSNGVTDQGGPTQRWDLYATAPPVGQQSSGC